MASETSLEVLVVGAGFAGLHALKKLRREGFNTKLYEAGNGIGGTWFWNCYPGAQTDSEFPYYQYTQDELWKGFEWKERFPSRKELLAYFQHVDNKLNLSADIQLNTKVTSAEFNSSRNQWLVMSNNNDITWTNHLVLCLGYSARRYVPPLKGLDTFKGVWHHTSLWPQEGVDLVGKRVAIIGTGASGVQLIEKISSEVEHLTVYQRTPNLALPMQQSSIEDQRNWKFPRSEEYQEIFQRTHKTFSGMDVDFMTTNVIDSSPEERREIFEKQFQRGGFDFWIGTYKDILYNKEANDIAYEFWCEKTRARVNDPIKKDILAPKIPSHTFGTKRPCLEKRYFEVFNQDNVDLINVRQSPILEVTEKGIITEKGLAEVDVIIFATGFDGCSGGMLDIQITNEEGKSLQEKWKNGVWTHIAMGVAGFPNMFMVYGPQGPTTFCNGPTCAEIQGDWIGQILVAMKHQGKTNIVATEEAERKWKKTLTDIWNASLFPGTDSWYQGANIPGKIVEPLNYAGGLPSYIRILEDCAKNGYEGFVLT